MNELLALFERIATNLDTLCEYGQELQGISEGLDRLEQLLEKGQKAPCNKTHVTPKELAELTAQQGSISYSYFTLRQACNLGRIPGAFKQPYNKRWLIPQEQALIILSEGLPAA